MNYNYDKDKGGIKKDEGKALWHLLPLHLLKGVIGVLMDGAKKYDEWNWTKGMEYSRVYNSTLRHLTAFMWDREDWDPESGRHHLDHAICNLLFLRYYSIYYPTMDDRRPALPAPTLPTREPPDYSEAKSQAAIRLDPAQKAALIEQARRDLETMLSRSGRPSKAQAWKVGTYPPLEQRPFPQPGTVLLESSTCGASAGPDGDNTPLTEDPT